MSMGISPAQFAGSGTDNESLFLKMYTGSFAMAPRSGIFLYGGVASRYLYRESPGAGKSWQFLMFGEVPDAEDFVPGSFPMGQIMAIEEGTITTDQFIVCHQWLGQDKIQQAHFQVFEKLAIRHKSRLERAYDKRAFIKAAYGARQTSAVTKNGLNIHLGGTRVTRNGGSAVAATAIASAYPASATGAANFRADLRTKGLAMDNKFIGAGPQHRGIFLTPEIRNVLSYDATGQVFSKDYVTTNDQQRHEIEVLENFGVIGYPAGSANNGPIPQENFIGSSTLPSKYQVNFLPQAADGVPVAISFNRTMDGEYGVGVIEFTPITHIVKWFPERLAYLVMTYMRAGCDVMHPWALGTIEVESN